MFSLRDKNLAEDIVSQIKKAEVHLKFMHVCGTHQDTLVKHGLDVLLQKCGLEIGQGPGCPVCVTTPKEIEEVIVLAKDGKTIASFGDMIRVPGASSSLQQMKGEGCDIRTVYSIEDSVVLAEKHKDKEVVFMAVGFETTAPTTASVLLRDPPSNFSVLCCHRLIPPALQAILDMGEIKIDGFIEPGHVSTIIGAKPYEFISKDYHVPQVIAGFEPLDLLMASWMLVRQIQQGTAIVENEYSRAVDKGGNQKAQQVIKQVFEPMDVKWRGFPIIPHSGLMLREKYASYDARKRYEDELGWLAEKEFAEPAGCLCGDVLRGLISSKECPLFRHQCTPETPVGPCMVSSEGNCYIEYLYSKK
ncbi:MAG TPA: hydrogenase formation protein HypD [Thermoplasmata archaeon]|jgi:hydrogenase expression/formation protein HypD|nr:MAG TPA: hydrogenase formation protein HypD [Thermoplasmata archaeon]